MEQDHVMIGGKYRVIKKLGGGGFGVVYQVLDEKTNKSYAAKLEIMKENNSIIEEQIQIIKSLKGTQGVFTVHEQGIDDRYKWVIIDLLGPSLGKIIRQQRLLINKNHNIFSKQSIVLIGIQIISRIQSLHSKGYIHRDLKPDNLAFGLGSKKNFLHLIDFGLSKKFVNIQTKKQLPITEGYQFLGTPLFASRAAHLGYQQFRKDDIESIGYILIYLFKGYLPWTTDCSIAEIGRMKLQIDAQTLCFDLPNQIRYLMEYCWSMNYYDKPDYSKMKNLMKQLIVEKEIVQTYEWEDVRQRNRVSDFLKYKK